MNVLLCNKKALDLLIGGECFLTRIKSEPLLCQAFSSISGMALINKLCTEAQKLVLEQGVEPLIFSSQNVDGFNNEDVYDYFKGRLKSM